MRSTVLSALALSAVIASLAACSTHETSTDNKSPNPAAVFCVEQSGEYLLDKGLCRLPGGQVVDAWDYYREFDAK